MGIEFTSPMVESIIAYVGNVFSDLKLPIVLLLGLMIGFFILDGVLGVLIRKKEETE